MNGFAYLVLLSVEVRKIRYFKFVLLSPNDFL